LRAFRRINREIHLEEDFIRVGLREGSLDSEDAYQDFNYFRHNYRSITPPQRLNGNRV
jgi:hypothetical protein